MDPIVFERFFSLSLVSVACRQSGITLDFEVRRKVRVLREVCLQFVVAGATGHRFLLRPLLLLHRDVHFLAYEQVALATVLKLRHSLLNYY